VLFTCLNDLTPFLRSLKCILDGTPSIQIIQIESTSLTNALNHVNVMLALRFGAFGIFMEVVNLIYLSMST